VLPSDLGASWRRAPAVSVYHLIVHSYLTKSVGLLMASYTLRRARNDIEMVKPYQVTSTSVVLTNLPDGPLGPQVGRRPHLEALTRTGRHWRSVCQSYLAASTGSQSRVCSFRPSGVARVSATPSTTCLLALMRIYAGGPVGIKFSSEEHTLNGVVRAHTTITVTKPTLWSDEDCLVVQQALLACIGEASSSR
jgi:hypothetical protein